MTFTEWYHQVIDYFSNKSINVFLHGSTLLGAVRKNELYGPGRMTFDKEINIGIRSDNLSQQLLFDMQRDFPYFQSDGQKLPHSLTYFGPEPIIKYHSVNKDMWAMEPGMCLLATFWKGKTKWIEYMGGDLCLTWPREQLDTYQGIYLHHRNVTVPNDRHKWLEHYFGDDYMEENKNWHWIKDSHNMESFDKLMEEGEFEWEKPKIKRT